MSNPRLPAELLDHVVDHLHDDEYALRNCCLISKSWVPRTRMHLFADITFDTAKRLRSWRKTFSDPSTSPAYYTETLCVHCLPDIIAAGAEAGRWIRTFSGVVVLKLTDTREKCVNELRKYLVPFHGLSPIVKSLCVEIPVLPSSQIFDLILSFPLVEDLTVITYISLADDKDTLDLLPISALPSTPPMTGSLSLFRQEGLKPLARRLLSLPGGIHFQNINLRLLFEEDLSFAMALVEGCSHTPKSLDLSCVCFSDEPRSTPIDLSKAAGLENVTVRVNSQAVCWVTMVLQTIPLEHSDLRQISIYLPFDSALIDTAAAIRQPLGEALRRRWSGLDRLLVRLWELRSIRPRVGCIKLGEQEQNMEDNVRCFLPEIMRRGIVDLV